MFYRSLKLRSISQLLFLAHHHLCSDQVLRLVMVERAKRLCCEKESQRQLGRLPVWHPLFADRLEPQVDLLDRLAACHLLLGLRVHRQVLALLHQ